MLNLSLGANMNPDDIEEGDDVYFDCQMDSNPYAYKVVWKHNVRKYTDINEILVNLKIFSSMSFIIDIFSFVFLWFSRVNQLSTIQNWA